MYRRPFLKLNILIILSGLLTLGLEFGCYIRTNSTALLFAVAILGCLIFPHIFLEVAKSYHTCFVFILSVSLLAGVTTILSYFNLTKPFFTYHRFFPYLCLLHWLVPVAYATLRCLFDKGCFIRYRSFFTKAGILFAVCYLPVLIVKCFLLPLTFPSPFAGKSVSLLPFMATATHIEDFIYTGAGLTTFFIFLFRCILLFLPLGFYGSILLKERAFVLRGLLWLCLSILPEVYLWFFYHSFMIDACIYRLFGILLGVLVYQTLNHLFVRFTRAEFLKERNLYSFFS